MPTFIYSTLPLSKLGTGERRTLILTLAVMAALMLGIFASVERTYAAPLAGENTADAVVASTDIDVDTPVPYAARYSVRERPLVLTTPDVEVRAVIGPASSDGLGGDSSGPVMGTRYTESRYADSDMRGAGSNGNGGNGGYRGRFVPRERR